MPWDCSGLQASSQNLLGIEHWCQSRVDSMLDENRNVWAGVGWGESRLLLTSFLFCHAQTWQGDIETYQLLVALIGYWKSSSFYHSWFINEDWFIFNSFVLFCFFLIEKHSSLMSRGTAEPCLFLQEKEWVVSFFLMSARVPRAIICISAKTVRVIFLVSA